jgi:hypothetical protein
MSKLFPLLFLLLSFNAGAQMPAPLRAAVSNERSTSHVNIPGTRLYIVPPPGFTVSNRFAGLEKGANSMVTVMDLVGGNYYTNAKTFSKEKFASSGIEVFEYRELKVNGYRAKYVSMQGDPLTRTYALVFGDSTFSTMIMCVYGAEDTATGAQIIAALNTIHYDRGKTVDPFANAFFTIGENGSAFKFAKFSAGMYIYTLGGITDEKKMSDQLVLLMSVPMDEETSAQAVAEMMLAKTEKYGLSDKKTSNRSGEKINGKEAYLVEVTGKINGEDALVFTAVVKNGDKAIIFNGVARKEGPANRENFMRLLQAIRFK